MIRTVAGLLPSTPADSACVELGALPFRYLVTATTCCRAIAYEGKTSGIAEVALLEVGSATFRELARQELPPVSRIHWTGARRWDAPKIHVDLSIANKFRAGSNSVALRTHVAERIRLKYHAYTLRFTDGSKNRESVGYGTTDDMVGTFRKLPNQCSIFSAEAAAILHAVSIPSQKPLCIVSDSASVLRAVDSPTAKHPWIQGIQRYSPPNTTLLWVPGHCGIQGNMEADLLAGLGRAGRLATRKVPGSDLKLYVKDKIWETWSAEWSNNRDLFLRKVKGETGRWTDLSNPKDQRILSRLRSGHTRATHNMGGLGPFRKECDICGCTMTIEHIISTCPVFQHIRDLYNIPNSIRDALRNEPTMEAALLSFIKDAGLYTGI